MGRPGPPFPGVKKAIAIVALVGGLAVLASCDGGPEPIASSTSSTVTASDVGETPETSTTTTLPTTTTTTTVPPTTTTAPPSTTTTTVPPTTTTAPPSTTTTTTPPEPTLWERLQASGREGVGDSLYPTLGSSGYDVESYLIEMRFDPIARWLSASSTITAMVTADLDLFSLDFFGMETSGVTVNGAAAGYEQVSEELIIEPSHPLGHGDSMTVVVFYEGGVVSRPAQAIQGYTSGGHWSVDEETFFVLNEPDGSAAWAPFNDHPLDKALVTVEVEVPAGWTAVSGGRLVESREEGQAALFRWSMEYPVAPYWFPSESGGLLPVPSPTPWVWRSPPGIRRAWTPSCSDPFTRQHRFLQFLSGLFGPYPFETVGAMVVDAGVGLVLEHQTLPTYDISLLWEEVVIHELAHQWFGDSVSVADWSDIWLNEGPATLAEWLWTEELWE